DPTLAERRAALERRARLGGSAASRAASGAITVSNTNQLLSTVAGGVIGFFVGGPAGALRGAQIGFLPGSALFPGELLAQRVPRLEDFETLYADPVSPVAIVFSPAVASGFRLYTGPATDFEETAE